MIFWMQFIDDAVSCASVVFISFNSFECDLINDWSDIRRKLCWITKSQNLHRASQHFYEIFRDILLNANHPARRTPLASALEGRIDDVLNGLFQKRCGVHDHRVDSASFGDERNVAAPC